MSQKTELLRRAYRLLSDITPLKYDCGRLCGAKCCKPNAVESVDDGGMLLLPEEENLALDESFRIEQGKDGKILICTGVCDRSTRPFMCRIFPFLPELKKDEKNKTHIHLKPDARAFRICPVAAKTRHLRSSVYFRRNATRAVRILINDADFYDELIKMSLFSDNILALYKKMFNLQ